MQTVKDIMTPGVETLSVDDTVAAAAALMRDEGIGDVVLVEGQTVVGIVTDRDITIRAVAEGLDPGDTPLRTIASTDLAVVTGSSTIEEARDLMRTRDIRRLPVVENGFAVGFLTLGDLAIETAPKSVLGDISAASDNV